MVSLASLWLPILLGGLAVFLASFVMRMVLRHHWNDYRRLPDEDAVMEVLRSQDAHGHQYAFPDCASPEQMKDPAYMEKWRTGPSGFLFLQPAGGASFARSLAQSFLFNVFVAFVTAYLASIALTPDAGWLTVLRFTATVGFLGFGASEIWGPIWKSSSWSVCVKDLVDALVYGLAMGAVFVALWP